MTSIEYVGYDRKQDTAKKNQKLYIADTLPLIDYCPKILLVVINIFKFYTLELCITVRSTLCIIFKSIKDRVTAELCFAEYRFTDRSSYLVSERNSLILSREFQQQM